MKIKSTLIFLLFIVFGSGFAQIKDFNLSNYKLPNLERHSLETTFSLGGSNNYSRIPEPSSAYEPSSITDNGYSGNVALDYGYYLNNAKHQRNLDVGFRFASYMSNHKEDGEMNRKSNSVYPIFYCNSENRHYYQPNGFVEWDCNLNYRFVGYKSIEQDFDPSYGGTGETDVENKKQNHDLYVLMPLKIGRGRIEQVQDARHAVYLFDELMKVDRLAPVSSNREVIALAKLISTLKNKRFFDSRLRRIAELEAIDSFFIANNILLKPDAKYFTTLGDFWDYGDRPIRNSGIRSSAVFMPGYYYENHKRTSTKNSTTDEEILSADTYLLSAGYELNYEKPINLFWQNTIKLSFLGGFSNTNIQDGETLDEVKLRVPIIQMGFFQTIGFYPNTRTDMSVGYSAQYVKLYKYDGVNEDVTGIDAKGVKATANFSLNYYISPKFKLNAHYSLYYVWQKSPDEMTIDFNNVLKSGFASTTNYTDYYNDRIMNSYFNISLLYTFF